MVLSVFGRVEYQRAYYAGCPCGQGKAPLDEQYGIEPGQVSAGLANLLSLAGVELPFEHSAKSLKEFLLFDISENTIRQETQRLGRLQMAQETELARQSQDLTYLQTRLRQPGEVPQQSCLKHIAPSATVRSMSASKRSTGPKTFATIVTFWKPRRLGN